MGRRRSKSGDGLLAFAASLPWWLGLLAAALSYWGMRRLELATAGATRPVELLLAGAAPALKLALPIVFVVGALLSALVSRKRAGLLAAAKDEASGTAAIQGMSWVEFEQLLSEAFRRQGYRVKETGGGGADGGIDLQLERAGQVELVQCKHWRAFKVGVPIVREMLGLVTAHKAAAGWVITSGKFTAEARQFADGKPLQLVDGVGLAGLLKRGGGARPTTGAEAPAATGPVVAAPAGDASSSVAAPSCPKCGRAMVRRTASKGANAGQWFWGCGGFPGCRGTRVAAQ